MRRELNRILDEIFKSTDDSLADMARKSGLCYSTVRNLDVRATRFPQFRTVWNLAHAYGFAMTLNRIVKARRAG